MSNTANTPILASLVENDSNDVVSAWRRLSLSARASFQIAESMKGNSVVTIMKPFPSGLPPGLVLIPSLKTLPTILPMPSHDHTRNQKTSEADLTLENPSLPTSEVDSPLSRPSLFSNFAQNWRGATAALRQSSGIPS